MMRRTNTTAGSRRGGLTLLALAAAVAGVIIIIIAVHGQQSVPQVPKSAAGTIESSPSLSPSPSPSPSPSQTSVPKHDASTPAEDKPKPLPPSQPVAVSIPAIGVNSEMFPIGKAPDGTLAVPQPGPNLNKVAWFENSPTPGQPGPSVIEGHVDSVQGTSVFFKLADVRPGNKITVDRKDGTTVEFTVNAVRDFAKSKFPTKLVYGGDLGTPTLRVITCSDFDTSIRHHTGNTVVFAHLTAVHKAK